MHKGFYIQISWFFFKKIQFCIVLCTADRFLYRAKDAAEYAFENIYFLSRKSM